MERGRGREFAQIKKLCYTKAMEQRGMDRKQIFALAGRASSLLFANALCRLHG